MPLLHRWFRRRRPDSRRRYRPSLEPLEQRTLLTTYTVTTTNDVLNDTTPGEVTLRDVITAIDTQKPSGNAAAGTVGQNTIDFHIGRAGTVQTISLVSALPALTEPVFIDGWSQGSARYAGPPLIVLAGGNAGAGADGLAFAAGSDGSTVRGLVIEGFSDNGIEIRGASGVHVTANYIGTDATGTTALGNGNDAILIDQGAADNIIGGRAPGSGNVICGSVNAPPGGTAGTETGTFSLSPASISGSIASFNVTVNYTDAANYQMVYVGVDLRGNSGTLAPIDPNTGQPDWSAFNFIPSSTLGAGWEAINNAFPGEFLFQTPPSSGGTPAGLAPNASYFIGTITYDLARFGITPGPTLSLSIVGTDTVIGSEKPHDPRTFRFINPNFAVAEQPLVNAAPTTAGVEIAGAGTSGNQVLGNFIGTKSGGKILGQLGDGVLIDSGASGNTIGGTTARAGNVVVGNDTGIVVTDAGTSGNIIIGNRIGTNARDADLANTVAGVLLENGAAGNSIGGTTSGSANLIAFNGKGVVVGNSATDTATIHDAILGNRIFANVVSAIELGNSGPTPNGPNPRAYPNDGQNTPLITAITPHAVDTSLTSVADTSFRVEFFATPVGNSRREQAFLGFVDVTTDATGQVSFVFPIAQLPVESVITATATNLVTGDTSEASPVGTQIVVLDNPVINSSNTRQTATVGVEILTPAGPPTSGEVLITVSDLPGEVKVPLTGKPVILISFPVLPGAHPGKHIIVATVMNEDNGPQTSATGVLLVTGAIGRRWFR